MCNCKRKNQVINNLDKPSYVQLAIDVVNRIGDTPVDQLDPDILDEMYMTYTKLYPNSKGVPERSQLLEILKHSTQFKKIYK